VLGVIVALLLGASVFMGTVAFGMQHFFEWQLEGAAASDNVPAPRDRFA
jgi:hypothetical protein